MKTRYTSVLLLFPLLILFAFNPFQTTAADGEFVSPTPAYDPLVEPPLPDNPTEYELGRNLYWHWCMTCHGDRGQGLTDEFRGIWEPEHQNCWGRGCHGGRSNDGGFPIPTVVPAVVDETHLAKFASVQELSDFLKTTHPPQSPGILKSEEYHAIARFVFAMNERPPINEFPASSTPEFIPTLTSVSPNDPTGRIDPAPVNAIVVFSVLAILIFVFMRGRHV